MRSDRGGKPCDECPYAQVDRGLAEGTSRWGRWTLLSTNLHRLMISGICSITTARKFRMLLHINPKRQRGKRTGSLAGAF